MSECQRNASGVRPNALNRIIIGESPVLEDFLSARELGKPLRDVRYEREWREGVSLYDDLDHAIRKARGYRGNVGAFIVRLAIPLVLDLEVRQTSTDAHHFTIYSDPAMLYGLVEGPSISIWRARWTDIMS